MKVDFSRYLLVQYMLCLPIHKCFSVFGACPFNSTGQSLHLFFLPLLVFHLLSVVFVCTFGSLCSSLTSPFLSWFPLLYFMVALLTHPFVVKLRMISKVALMIKSFSEQNLNATDNAGKIQKGECWQEMVSLYLVTDALWIR